MKIWTHDNTLIDAQSEINEFCWFYGVDSLEDVPSFQIVPQCQWNEISVGDVVELANGKNALVFDIFYDVKDNLHFRAITESLHIVEKIA